MRAFLSIRGEPVSIVGIVVVQGTRSVHITHVVGVGSVRGAQPPVASCMIYNR